MTINFFKIIFYFLFLVFFSCTINVKLTKDKDSYQSEKKLKIIVQNSKLITFNGWWVYGEDQHIFKDEKTLEEYDLEFQNENMEELRVLYLAVCEMEYFPMESAMTGYLKKDILEKKNTLVVTNFEILHIVGCGD